MSFKVEQSFKTNVPKIIDDAQKKLTQNVFGKTQVYFYQSQLKEVNNMCQRQTLRAINLSHEEVNEEVQEEMSDKSVRTGNQDSLRQTIRGACRELFQKHLTETLKQTIVTVNSELISKPISIITKSYISKRGENQKTLEAKLTEMLGVMEFNSVTTDDQIA